ELRRAVREDSAAARGDASFLVAASIADADAVIAHAGNHGSTGRELGIEQCTRAGPELAHGLGGALDDAQPSREADENALAAGRELKLREAADAETHALAASPLLGREVFAGAPEETLGRQ